MDTELTAAKAALRNRLCAALKTISPGARAFASAQACDRLQTQPIWKSARAVLFFAPLPGELDLWPLLLEALAEGKAVALPRFASHSQTYGAARIQDLRGDLHTGRYNVREPAAHCAEIPREQLDLVLVPGLAFDLRGGRLGRGRGFYDRLLAGIRGLKCGVAFDEQIVEEVPTADHDARMDFVLTPTRWVKTGD